DYIKMEMQKPLSSKVKFIATCSYSRLNDFITSRKNDPKLLQTLISTSSSFSCFMGSFRNDLKAGLGVKLLSRALDLCESFLEKFETTPSLKLLKFNIEEKNSGSTTIHADISLQDLECVYFKSEPDLGDLTSIDPGIRENVSSTTNVNLPFDDDQSPLFAYVVYLIGVELSEIQMFNPTLLNGNVRWRFYLSTLPHGPMNSWGRVQARDSVNKISASCGGNP
ncbi:hypothetical protein Tco_0870117, partial [Tanacetum coccineum]